MVPFKNTTGENVFSCWGWVHLCVHFLLNFTKPQKFPSDIISWTGWVSTIMLNFLIRFFSSWMQSSVNFSLNPRMFYATFEFTFSWINLFILNFFYSFIFLFYFFIIIYFRRRKGEKIFLVAFYECDEDFELENLEHDRLYCSHERWIGNFPNCMPLEEESEEEEDEGENWNWQAINFFIVFQWTFSFIFFVILFCLLKNGESIS